MEEVLISYSLVFNLDVSLGLLWLKLRLMLLNSFTLFKAKLLTRIERNASTDANDVNYANNKGLPRAVGKAVAHRLDVLAKW